MNKPPQIPEAFLKALPRGAYHRRIVLIPEKDSVRAGLEDESHRMEMTVFHDGSKVTAIDAKTVRVPWNICPGAADKVRELIGVPLQRLHQSTGHDGKQHCTHLFDLARLAVARACVGTPVQYDGAVADRIDRKTHGALLRDGKRVMAWDVNGSAVTGPDPFTGHSLRGAPQWPADLDEETLEAALVLRRIFLVAQIREPQAATARDKSLGEQIDPVQMIKAGGMMGRCYTFQPGRIEDGKSHYSWRNFALDRENLLAGFNGVRTLKEMGAG
jgi:hypothetical protein